MKSSTIRRSTLSKESMDVIENLASESQLENENIYSEVESDNLPDEYVRPESDNRKDNKAKEIDLLWQSFKTTQSSPLISVLTGFILGTITTLLLITFIGSAIVNNANSDGVKIGSLVISKKLASPKIEENINSAKDIAGKKVTILEEEKVNTPEQDESAESQKDVLKNKVLKKYTIKDGDTVERIIKHYYGAYTPERAEMVMKANNLSNLDHISIGQILIIPMDK
jgi:LysM repeat protein